MFLQFSLQILPLRSYQQIADKIVFPHRTLMGGAWLNISLKLRHFVESDKLIFPVSCDKNQMVGLKFPQRYFPLVSLRCCNGVFWWGAGMKISPHLYVLGTNCALKSRKKVQICKKVKDYKYLLLKQSTFFLGKKSNEEQPRRGVQIILGKNAKKIEPLIFYWAFLQVVFELCTIIVLCTSTHFFYRTILHFLAHYDVLRHGMLFPI